MTFEFWWRWMLLASLFFVAFGVAAAIAPNSPLFEIWMGQIDGFFFDGQIEPRAKSMRGFLMGPLGGTIAGSYVLQTFIVAIPFKRQEAWAWHAVLWSMLLWFVVDSTMCLIHRAYFNVYLINLMPLGVFGIPLIATRRSMLRASAADGAR